MSTQRPRSGLGKLAKLAIAAAALGAVSIPIAVRAQPYLGWDFGHGFGIGIGTPPSAYSPCPNYGWPFYRPRCGYHYHPHYYHPYPYRR